MEEITLQAKIENIPVITEFIDSKLEALDCNMKAQMQIDVAIDELLSNVALYAYGESEGNMSVTLEFIEDDGQVILSFIDQGTPFDPLAKDDPDVTLSAQERQIGGLGIFLVKKTMDQITYEYTDSKNITRIYKKIR